jgi:drug/metabolite transporter (DMT)-like permease
MIRNGIDIESLSATAIIAARCQREEGAAMSQLGRLRWGWIIVGGVVAGLALMLFVPIQFLPGGEAALLYLVAPLCVIVTGLVGYWIARKTDDLRLLHGGLVGAVALLIYTALTWTEELPAIYWVANYLKIAGGLIGAWVADRRVRSTTYPAAEAGPT